MAVVLAIAACSNAPEQSLFNTTAPPLPPLGEVGTTDPDTSGGELESSETGFTTGISGASTDSGEASSTPLPGSDSTGPETSTTDSPGACTPPVAGVYANCVEDGNAVCANATAVCLEDNVLVPTQGVCAPTGCTEVCDCPPAPPDGTAAVACADLVGNSGNLCFLDCSSGRTCPAGMQCFGNQACMFPSACTRPPGAYGNCVAGDFTGCQNNASICIVDDVDDPSQGVCSLLDCVTVCDCPLAPAGGTAPAICSNTVLQGENACVLDCSAGQTCPPPMTCAAFGACVFPG